MIAFWRRLELWTGTHSVSIQKYTLDADVASSVVETGLLDISSFSAYEGSSLSRVARRVIWQRSSLFSVGSPRPSDHLSYSQIAFLDDFFAGGGTELTREI